MEFLQARIRKKDLEFLLVSSVIDNGESDDKSVGQAEIVVFGEIEPPTVTTRFIWCRRDSILFTSIVEGRVRRMFRRIVACLVMLDVVCYC